MKPGSYFDHWEKLYAKPVGAPAAPASAVRARRRIVSKVLPRGRRAIDAMLSPCRCRSDWLRGRRPRGPSSDATPRRPRHKHLDLTIVSAANDRYRARDLAVLVQMREKATKEGLNVRIVSYNLGGESKCGDGSLPGIWARIRD